MQRCSETDIPLTFLVCLYRERSSAPYKLITQKEVSMELFGINTVSRKTGIHQSRLRRWEAMGLIEPARIDMGQTTLRIYTSAEVELVRRVKELLEEGIQLRTAFEWATGNHEKD
jgi:hypothetical protein